MNEPPATLIFFKAVSHIHTGDFFVFRVSTELTRARDFRYTNTARRTVPAVLKNQVKSLHNFTSLIHRNISTAIE